MRMVLATAAAVLVFGVSGMAPSDAAARGGAMGGRAMSGGHHGGSIGGGALPPGTRLGGLGASANHHRFGGHFSSGNVGRFRANQFHNGRFRDTRFRRGGGFLYGGLGYYGGFDDGYGYGGSGDTTQAVYVDTPGVREDPVSYRPPEPITPACFTIAKVWNAQLKRNLDQTVRHAC